VRPQGICEAILQQVLTDGFIRAARAPATARVEISDLRCAGLALRITAKGVKSWAFRFRDPTTGRDVRTTIGRYPDISLSAARTQADIMRQEVAAGDNPAERKKEGRATAGSKSFGALAERYLTEHARRKKRSHKADERNLRKHVLPHWGNRAYVGIKRADVIERLESLISAGKPTLANRVQSLISSIFTFALDADLVEANPCHRLRKRGVETVGTRVLSDDEIALFWDRIIEVPKARRTGLGLRLCLLVAARVGEVAGMSRAELEHISDEANAAWIIPGSRTKNKRDHLVPLSALARATVIDLLELIGPEEQFLFPTRSRRRVGPIRPNSLTQAMDYFGRRLTGQDEAERTWKLEPPTPHDLRRTVETRMASLRIPKEIRDRVLNHIPSDVGSKHYNRHDYADEKRDALNRWACALSAVLNDGIAK
jgi:integrase